MNQKEKVIFALYLARKGEFGTIDNPNRGSSGKCVFWNSFIGIRSSKDYSGTTSYPYARAGELFREESK